MVGISWVTVVWSMGASACITLAAMYFLVWCQNRSAHAHLLFSLTAASTAVYAFFELSMMRAQTPQELDFALRWCQVPLFFWLLSLTWFVWIYLDAGRRWLAWTIFGLRTLYVLPNLLIGGNVTLRAIPGLQHMQFLGDSVTVNRGVPNPWNLLGSFTVLLVLIFVADASVAAWRRGDRRKALIVGGSAEFFLGTGLVTSVWINWGGLHLPQALSLYYLGLVAVMGYELSRDVLRASQLGHELRASEAGLRESEQRMSLAVEVADIGIWIRDLSRNDIWASEKWRELFGFAPSEPVEFNAFLKRLHPDDREGLQQALARAVAGGGHYQMEFRLKMPDGAIRWISSLGRVERDAAGQPVLIRGASREVTARKRTELALHTLSGRLLVAQEEERHRIARELHDNLSQQMALLAIEIEQVAVQTVRSPAVARSLRHLGERTAEISTEIHNISHRLHSAKLEALGLAAAVRGHCREISAHGVQVQFSEVGAPGPVSPDVALCLFRIVQEGLNNVIKHSGATEAHVTLSGTSEALQVSIADSGRGFDETAAADRDGLGLASMRERLRLIGGELTIRSRAGQGTTIDARVPLTIPAGQSAASDSVRVA
jgi:PAS domain S-box-containing protein